MSVVDVGLKQVQVYLDPLTEVLGEPCVQNWLVGLQVYQLSGLNFVLDLSGFDAKHNTRT